MNLPHVFSPNTFALYKTILKPWILLLLTAFLVAGCGGGGSATPTPTPTGAALGGGQDNESPDNGELPTEPVANSNPVVDSLLATVSEDDSRQYNLSWQISDVDGDSITCLLDPGGGLAVQQIADCTATTQALISYSSDGEITVVLTANDPNGGSSSREVVFTLSSPVTMTGVVTSYPDSETPAADDAGESIVLSDADNDTSSLSRQDMTPVEALVSLFALADVDFSDPIATVKTDVAGRYEITARDVRDYLLAIGAIEIESSEADVIAAFRSLGRLQVRALIVNERDGLSQALAIQTIADPSNIDENGAPVPVAVDPITHRVVKAIVDQIRDSVSSLEAMGLPPSVVNDLIDTVISTVVVEIDRVLDETANDLIDIPDGQTVAEVVQAQEQELAVSLDEEDVSRLTDLLDSENSVIEEQALAELESSVVSAEAIVEDSQSNLQGSLDSESRGLLSGLEAVISENVTDTVEDRIAQAQQVGTDEALSEIFGEREEGADFQQLLEAAELEKSRTQRRSIQRFFLSLGLAVLVEENAAGDGGIVALRLSLPSQLDNTDLPGAAGFDERDIRLFKVGDGPLDSGSIYTDDPLVPLGMQRSDGFALPPFQYVPRLSDVLAESIGNAQTDNLQPAIDEAWLNINVGDSLPTDADYLLLDRMAMLNELHQRLQESTLVSSRVIDSIIENREIEISIKRLASVISDHFQWVGEEVNLTPEGFPVFTDRQGPLYGGANLVDSSELIRVLSFTLGETATQTAQVLTQRTSFYAQYAADAIDAAISSAALASTDNPDFGQLLLDIYPSEAIGYYDLIVGVDGENTSARDYSRARDRVASGLTAALPRNLYGQTLTSESTVSIRAAIFLLDYVLNGNYPIDPSRGYFTEFEIVTVDGETGTRYVPNYSNLKRLEPTGEISVANIISSLLSVTEIDNGNLFDVASAQLYSGLGDIPVLPEFRDQDIDDIDSGLGERANRIDALCTIERFDGQDPDAGAEHDRLRLSVFHVDYIHDTGEFIKGERIDASITSALVSSEGALRRTYRIEELSALNGAEYGRDYVIRLEIDGYQHELPELYFHADGYIPELDLCPLDAPLYIGPDQQFTQVPGVSLISDQHRGGSTGDELEGIDVSNFEVPGAPLYITPTDESVGHGRADFGFVSSSAGFHLTAVDGTDTVFAPLFAQYSQEQFLVSLDAENDSKPLYGMQSILGQNIRRLIEQASTNSEFMTSGLDVTVGNVTPERLYLMRDADGRFWVLEIRYADVYSDFDGNSQAFVDIGVASVNAIGDVTVPDVAFDEAVAEPYDSGGITFHRVYYGDWLILDNPTGYSGPEILPAEPLSFGTSDDYSSLLGATDGVVIRYAGDHFDENIQVFEDLDTVFGIPPDYSSLPVRLDAGRPGLTFVKLKFSRQDKRYLMEPAPENAGEYTANLSHNDLIAIFDADSDNDGPLYLGRIIRDLPSDDPYAHFEMGLEVIRFDSIRNQINEFDERDVVCFTEADRVCPPDYPALVFSSDIDTVVGVVYDRDHDGLPALFDPNDSDPNVPGQLPDGSQEQSGYDFELLEIHATTRARGDGNVSNALVVGTRNIYPGDIARISLSGSLFGDQSAHQLILACDIAHYTEDGLFEPRHCEGQSVTGGIQVEVDPVSEFDLSVALLIPDEIRSSLGSHVSLAYEVEFHVPFGPDGAVLFCGDAECPSLPNATGQITVPLPAELPVIHDLSVSTSEENTSVAQLATLDVSREVRLFGAIVPDAIEYELSMICNALGAQGDYLPQEHFQIYAPARDTTGQSVPPEFVIHVPWLAGRICDIALRAPIANAAGDLTGYSEFRRHGIVTSEFLTPVYVDNEIDLAPGQSLCIAADGKDLQVDACGAERLLFNYDGPLSFSEVGLARVQLTSGPGVIESMLESQVEPVLQGRLLGDAFIAFNTEENPQDFLPTCGVITSDEASYNCSTDNESPALQDAFVTSPDLAELVLLPNLQDLGLSVLGNLNAAGNIPLLESGEYWLQVPETDELLEIYIEVFLDADLNERNVFVYMQRQGAPGGNSDIATVEASVPGFAFLEHQSGLAADIELRHLEGDILRIAWYLLDARETLAGHHDFNGDGEPEVLVTPMDSGWHFEFSESFDSVESLSDTGAIELPRETDGLFRLVVDSEQPYVEFILRAAGTEMVVRGELGNGGGYLDVISEYVFDETADALFGGIPVTDYFPTGIAIASPFANDADGLVSPGTDFGVFLFDGPVEPDCTDGVESEIGELCSGNASIDGQIEEGFVDAAGDTPVETAPCPDGSTAIDGIFCDVNGNQTGLELPPPDAEFCPAGSVESQCIDGEGPDYPIDGSIDGPVICADGSAVDSGDVAHCTGQEEHETGVANPLPPIDVPTPLIDYDPLALRGADAIRSDAERIAGVLAGRADLASLLRGEALTGGARNAECFGPSLAYRNHPDGTDRSGQISNLPGGDLGIWTEYDSDSGQVCAAAQLNEQLAAARQRTFAGLLTMAATLRHLSADEQAWLLDGGSVNVTDALQSQGVPGIEFLDATVTRQIDSGIWHYRVQMQQFDPTLDQARTSGIELVFDPLESEQASYAGLLRINTDDHVDGGNCPDTAVRHLSSVAFQRLEQGQVRTEYRYGMYCGHGAAGFAADGQVDPSYSQRLFDDGWANDFAIFSANFDPADNAGRYAYSWQAGAGDSHSRVLNVGIDGPEALRGDAWFGFGQSLTNAGGQAGTINGFICNWAGPGASHELIERAQYQSLAWDDSALQVWVGEGGSNITFAPTSSCVYHSDNGGSYLYDRDLDGDLSDESAATVDVGAGEILPLDLAPPESSAFADLDIEEVIAVRGYQRPQPPAIPGLE